MVGVSSAWTLVVLAGGLGSRFGAPKQLEGLGPGGQLLLEYGVYDATRVGCGHLVLVTREELVPAFKPLLSRLATALSVRVACQGIEDVPRGVVVPVDRRKPWGTGQALLAVRDLVDGPFVVLNADDFYGRGAFQLVAKFLGQFARAASDYAVIAYRLGAVLSEGGVVSRGLCRFSSFPFLRAIEEFKAVGRSEAGSLVGSLNGVEHDLSQEDWVSMGMMVLGPAVFEALERAWVDFFNSEEWQGEGEYLMGRVLEGEIGAKRARARVLENESSWLGVTYQREVPSVRAALRKLHESGVYPASLW